VTCRTGSRCGDIAGEVPAADRAKAIGRVRSNLAVTSAGHTHSAIYKFPSDATMSSMRVTTQPLRRGMRWTCRFASLVSFMIVAGGAAAQQLPRPPAPEIPNPKAGGNIGLADFFSGRTPYEFWLTCIIIAFGLVVIMLLLWHFRSIPDRRGEDVARAVVVVTVIVGTLILVTAGYSNDQIAPAFGLFGTIVGYILGRLGPRGLDHDPIADPSNRSKATGRRPEASPGHSTE
jgi:hypothetical protein